MPKPTVPAVSKLKDALAGEFAVYAIAGDPEDFVEAIATRILSLNDADSIIDAMGSTSEIPLGANILIENVTFVESRFEESNCGYFAVVRGKYLESGSWGESGDSFVGTCGGDTICLSFLRMNQINAFPKAMRIVQRETPTASGFYPLNLARSTVRTV